MLENGEKAHNKCTLSQEECQKLYEKMIQSLDGELSNEDEQLLVNQVANHPCCFEKLQIEKSYKEFVNKKFNRKTCCPELAITIREKINTISIQPNV